MPHSRPTVSVILPTLNEAKNLPLVFPCLPLDVIDEVILVDGRSTDGTVEVARQILPSVKVVLEPTPGKGAAMRAGYKAATGDILIVIDADGSNDPREIPRFIRALLEGSDFVKGSRFAPRGGTTDMPRYRKLGNGAFVFLVNLLFDATFTDLCYGYHAFWRYCLDMLDLSDVDGFEIDTAIYLRALRERLHITEVPSFEGCRFYGIGKLQTIPDGWRVLRTIFAEWMATFRRSERNHHLGFRGELPAATALSLLPAFGAAGDMAQAGALAVHPFGNAPSVLASNHTATETARATFQLLYTVSRLLAAEVDLRHLLEHILRLALESVGAASGSIMVLNDEGDVTEGCLLYGGEVRPLQVTGLNDIVEQGLAGWIVKNRVPVLVACTREDPRWLRRSWEEGEGASRSALGIPLIDSERVVGVLTLVRSQAGQFTPDDLALLTGMATCA